MCFLKTDNNKKHNTDNKTLTFNTQTQTHVKRGKTNKQTRTSTNKTSNTNNKNTHKQQTNSKTEKQSTYTHIQRYILKCKQKQHVKHINEPTTQTIQEQENTQKTNIITTRRGEHKTKKTIPQTNKKRNNFKQQQHKHTQKRNTKTHTHTY